MRKLICLLLVVGSTFSLFAQKDEVSVQSDFLFELQTKSKEHTLLLADTARLNQEIVQLKKSIKKLKKNKKVRKVRECKKQKKGIEGENKKLNDDKAKLVSEIDTLKKYKTDYENSLKREKGLITEKNDLEAKNVELLSEIDGLKTELEEAKAKNERYIGFHKMVRTFVFNSVDDLIKSNDFYNSQNNIDLYSQLLKELFALDSQDNEVIQYQSKLQKFKTVSLAFIGARDLISKDYQSANINNSISSVSRLSLPSNLYFQNEKNHLLKSLREYCQKYSDVYKIFSNINSYKTDESNYVRKDLDLISSDEYTRYKFLKDIIEERKSNISNREQKLKNIGGCN